MAHDATTILTAPVLVVKQKVTYTELNFEYSIFDRHGEQIGSVRRVGQNLVTRFFRRLSGFDSDLGHTLHILDRRGDVVLALTRPSVVAKLRSTVIVSDAQGREVGQIVEQKASADSTFSLESGDTPCGSIVDLTDADADYSIRDVAGSEVARITETFDESHLRALAKIIFTSSDDYLVEIHRPLDDPLRSLVVAAALAVDIVFNQVGPDDGWF